MDPISFLFLVPSFSLPLFFFHKQFSTPGNVSPFRPRFVLSKLYNTCSMSFSFPGRWSIPRVHHPLQRAQCRLVGGETACYPPPECIPCKPSQQKAPKEQMFLLKAGRNWRDHFSPHQVSRARGSCLPGTQTGILTRFMAELSLQEGGLTDVRMRLLTNPAESWQRAISE